MSRFTVANLRERGDTISAVQQWSRRLAAARQGTSSAGLGENQAGDTIVEVLIAIAIISVVLVTAYAITARNSAIMAATQEREQAQRLVEGQIEYLANAGKTNASQDCFTPGTGTDSGAICSNITATGSGATYTLIVAGPAPGASLPAACNAVSTTTNTYSICAYWTSLNSKSPIDSNVTMYYRLN